MNQLNLRNSVFSQPTHEHMNVVTLHMYMHVIHILLHLLADTCGHTYIQHRSQHTDLIKAPAHGPSFLMSHSYYQLEGEIYVLYSTS